MQTLILLLLLLPAHQRLLMLHLLLRQLLHRTLGECRPIQHQLQNSLQAGPIKYGFRREGKTLNQCVLFALFRCFYFRICNIFLSDNSHIDWRPVSSEQASRSTSLQERHKQIFYISSILFGCEGGFLGLL